MTTSGDGELTTLPRHGDAGHGKRAERDAPSTLAVTGTVGEAVTAEQVRALAEQTGVGTIMSRKVVCLAPDANVHAVTEMFLDRDFSSAPVVDGDWQPLAVVSKTDLLRYFSTGKAVLQSLREAGRLRGPQDGASQTGGALLAPAGADDAAPPASHTVADVTVPYVLSLHQEAPISVAAALMAYEGVHRLPIVDTTGEVIGVVSTLDIVRWLAESTGLGAEAMG